MILFIKGTAEPLPALVEDEPDPMTVDYRKRCVVTVPGMLDRIMYGVTATEYGGMGARDIHDRFDHSAGCGRLPGQQPLKKPKREVVEVEL